LRFGSCSFFAKRRCTGLNPKSETRLGCYTPTKKVIARKVRFRLLFADFGVVDFVAVAPLQFTAVHHVSTRGFQTAQNKSLGITEFQQISTSIEIWFGTRGSEVQILSPRPIIFKHLYRQPKPQNRPPGFAPDFSEFNSPRSRINTALPLFYTMQHRLQNRPQCCDGKTRCSTNRKPSNCKR
jgi:hypothetical protein